MAICINQPLITIGGLVLTELVKYDVNYSKLWKDADRNMNGDISSTLIGIFPNIDATTMFLTRTQVGTLCAALDQAYFSATFWDPASDSQKVASFYASDYKISLISRANGTYGTVDFSIVPISRRT